MNVTLRTPTIQSAIATGYQSGFGNGFETEALPGALPIGRNSPQKCPYGLYAEQLSAAHPSPRPAPATNGPGYTVSARPSQHWGRFRQGRPPALWRTAPCGGGRPADRAACGGSPIPVPQAIACRSSEGMHTITTAGDAGTQAGMAAHVYVATRSMVDEYFYNADGEMLVVPQDGALRFCTEFGVIDADAR